MQRYTIEITGKTPLLMHWDNIEWADALASWQADPEHAKASVPGDDRTPPWRWIGSVYHDGRVVGMPGENLMRCLMEGGAMVGVSGKGKKTYKAQTQSGMRPATTLWPLLLDGAEIPWADIAALQHEQTFSGTRDLARLLGFDLHIKRAKLPNSNRKHIRVRPEFPPGWTLHGDLLVWDEQLTRPVLERILNYAGEYKGLGDWRPGGKTPGPYGMFEARIVGVN